MDNTLASELKSMIKEEGGYNQNMTIEQLKDSEWCSITTSSVDICGDNIVIYARRIDGMIELSDFGVTDFNIVDDYKYVIEIECKIWHLLYGLGERTDIHTTVVARAQDFCYAFTQIDWATTSINNIVGHLIDEEEND